MDYDGRTKRPSLRDCRWFGHRLHAEVNLAVNPEISVERGHKIAQDARHRLLHDVRYLSQVTIHIDPETVSGEHHHRIGGHDHDDLPKHGH